MTFKNFLLFKYYHVKNFNYISKDFKSLFKSKKFLFLKILNIKDDNNLQHKDCGKSSYISTNFTKSTKNYLTKIFEAFKFSWFKNATLGDKIINKIE